MMIKMQLRTGRTHKRVLMALGATAVALSLASCRPDDDEAATRVAGWSSMSVEQRHPIAVVEEPVELSLKVPRDAAGLSALQQARAAGFIDRYRYAAAAHSRLVIEAPSGSANEAATMHAVADVRYIAIEAGIDPDALSVSAYHARGAGDAPVKISFMRAVAKAPTCGEWPDNLAEQRDNANYDNFGCAQQHNMAAMVANPSDLVTMRQRTAPPSERRDVVWEKYLKGESTVAQKSAAETVTTTGQQ